MSSPPFTYQPFVNPFAQAIGEDMLRGPEARARALEVIARARAEAAVRSGQVWGQTIQNIGQIPQQIRQQQIDQSKQEFEHAQAERLNLANDQTRTMMQGQQRLDDLMQQGQPMAEGEAGPTRPSYLQPDGLFDVPKLTQALSNSGLAHAAPDLLKGAEAINDSILKHQKLDQQASEAHTVLLGDLADGVLKLTKQGMPLPDAMDFVVQPAIATKRIQPQEYAQVKAQLANLPPEQQTAALTSLMDRASKLSGNKTLAKDAIEVDRYNRPVASNVVPDKPPAPSAATFAQIVGDPTKTPQERAAAQAQLDAWSKAEHPNPPAVKSLQRVPMLIDGKPTEVLLDPDPAATQKVFDLEGKPIANAASRAKPIPPASTIINPAALNDVKETVAGMKDGTLPPMMPGRATKEYLATMAEAHRQGYDLQGAVTDWNATQKHISTMNGAQQLRLNQSINALPELLDTVDQLASQWKGGKFPILNKANLALAKNGVYGSDVASVANKLDAQIADVTADLGNVYMGGNSPTDHALGLAAKSLSGSWDETVLHDMVNLARTNVTIRQNSIKHTGVAGASPNNPYAPQQDTSSTPKSAKDPLGLFK